ncbi:MAG: YkgJ family cysteine cluster protein [Deltaproteobacteria bacterium]|nr:YkgJ family cysteine cluster protein [Deltaproteobacteria bacterium]
MDPNRHPSGLPFGDGARTCATCAWLARDPHPEETRCVAAREGEAPGPVVPPGASACVLWEPPADCDPCGACCREAFDSVPVTDEDAARLTNAEDLIRTQDDGWRDLQRMPSPAGCGTWCVALRGTGNPKTPYRCVIYPNRPENCRDLEPGSTACNIARRRVGLSAWRPGQQPDGPLANRSGAGAHPDITTRTG